IGWLEGSVSMSSLQFHFLQTLEHRTDVSVTSTSLGGKLQRTAPRRGWPSARSPGAKGVMVRCAGPSQTLCVPTSAFCFPKLESVCNLLQLHLS
uniref:Uncharacterized protein n=1 Tax=Aquila chrysaetos chrysaetos TaxID=223781 RepID=A0A663F463_AQUCH